MNAPIKHEVIVLPVVPKVENHKADTAERTAQPRTECSAPVFTRKLSYEEQEAMPIEHQRLYWDWLFGVNEIVCVRRELRDRNDNTDWDKQRAIRDGEDLDINGSER